MPKVLIVEDDARVGAMLQSVLGARGYQVVSVRTGAEARRLVQADAPVLILVDHVLPDVDGLVLMSLLRAATQ
ncbi:MAG TPA: response regulator, partial [Chloroflexota bacterium]